MSPRVLQQWLSLLLARSCSAALAPDLTDIVYELNAGLQVETNIIFNTEHPLPNLEQLLQRTNATPKLLTTFEHWPLGNLSLPLDEPVVIIIGVAEPPTSFFELQHNSTTFQLADILLVTQQRDLAHLPDWQRFFAACRDHGLVRMLLSVPASQLLYRLQALPRVAVAATTVQDYLRQRNTWHNLQQYSIRLAVGHNPLQVLSYRDAKSGRQVYGGYFYRFIVAFAKAFNATFELRFNPCFGKEDCKQALKMNLSDVCGSTFHFFFKSQPSYYEKTSPITFAYSSVVVPNSLSLARYRYFVQPFAADVWLSYLIFVAALIVFLSLICWLQTERTAWHFSYFLLATLQSQLGMAFSLRKLQRNVRIILACMMFTVGFILSTRYTTFLASILSTEIYERNIRSLDELLASRYKILIDDVEAKSLRFFNLPDSYWDHIQIVSTSELRKHRSELDTNFAYMSLADEMILLDYQQRFLTHPTMYRIRVPFRWDASGFPMRRTWFLKHMLSFWILAIFNTGLLGKLKADALEEARRMHLLQFHNTEYYKVEALRIEYYYIPFVILFLGYLTALICFLIERFARKDKTRG